MEEKLTTICAASSAMTIEEHANWIHRIEVQREKMNAAVDIAEGYHLIAAKAKIGHGQWEAWLSENFGWSQKTANNLMRIAERFGDGKLECAFRFQKETLKAMLQLPAGEESKFIETQAENGRRVEEMTSREVKAAVKEWNHREEKNTPIKTRERQRGLIESFIEWREGLVPTIRLLDDCFDTKHADEVQGLLDEYWHEVLSIPYDEQKLAIIARRIVDIVAEGSGKLKNLNEKLAAFVASEA